MSGRPVVDVADLDVTYLSQDHPSLSGVDLAVQPGQCVLLAGGSGCGKSTLLRTLNGLVPHLHRASLEGRVEVAGMCPSKAGLASVGRCVSSVLQNPRTQFFCTDPASELAFASENYGRPPAEIRRRIDEARQALDLSDLMAVPMHHMSGGQRQRVAIGAGYVNRPELYLLDEPTSGLDPDSIARLAAMIAELRRGGATIIIADHRLAWLEGQVDRVVLLDSGRRTDCWDGEEFFAIPDSQWIGMGLRRLRPAVLPQLAPAPDSAAGLRLEGLRFSYRRGRRILDIDHAVFPRGAITVVTGPNGAGKTTLARAITGLLRPSGVVVLDGRRLSVRQRRTRCFLVMQDVNRQLFADSVREEIDVPEPQAVPLMARLGLDGLASRHPLALSGGQQQRAVIAAAMGRHRDVYVFDEPSSGLDRTAMMATAHLLQHLAQTGAVVILITHDDELAVACGDYGYRLG